MSPETNAPHSETSARRDLDLLPDLLTVPDLGALPPEAVAQATAALVDTLAAVLFARAGDRDAGAAWWVDAAHDPFNAVFENAYAAHRADFDSVHYLTTGHPAAVAFPALLALFERGAVPGSAVLAGYAAAVEAMSALGDCLGGALRRGGYHPTSVLGAPAVAGACAKVLGADQARVRWAMAAAAACCIGHDDQFGTSVKPFQVAVAARSALHCAASGAGTSAPELSAPWSAPLLRLAGPGDECLGTVRGYGEPWALAQVGHSFKRLPVCAWFDPLVAEGARIAASADGAPERVVAVRAHLPAELLRMNRFPQPQTPSQAGFSLPFLLATLLTHPEAGPEHFRPDRLADPAIRRLMARIAPVESDTDAHLEIRFAQRTRSVPLPALATAPVREDPVAAACRKLLRCARGVLSPAHAQELADAACTFADIPVKEWHELTRTTSGG